MSRSQGQKITLLLFGAFIALIIILQLSGCISTRDKYFRDLNKRKNRSNEKPNMLTFDDLSLEDKAHLIYEYGIKMHCFISYYDYTRHLYAVYGEFMDIWYNEHTRKIDYIKIVKYKDLDLYLQPIPIPYGKIS